MSIQEENVNKSVCVFSASSEAVDAAYFDAATELGRRIAEAGWSMIFGGGMTGLMGATARAVHAQGGRVIGVIPDGLNRPGVAYEAADELIVTETLRERKAIMDARSDAFIALPGGFGTLEEIIEAMALKQLRYHDRPVVFLNTAGFYDPLLDFFDHQVAQQFVKAEHRRLYYVADTPEDAVDHVRHYAGAEAPEKFF